MEKITTKEVRQILAEHIDCEKFKSELAKKSDEELLRTNIQEEFELDSLDRMDMLTTLYTRHRIWIEERAMAKSSFHKDPTVENFIKMVNDYEELQESA